MKWTNNEGLPQALFDSITQDDHRVKGNYSVTELIGPPQISFLRRQHKGEMVDDAANHIYRVLGTGFHRMMAESAGPDAVTERTITAMIKGPGPTLYGTPDLYDPKTKTLWDYKTSSIWVFKDGVKPEYKWQSHLYRWLLERVGHPVERQSIIAIYRDWSKPKSRTERGYPRRQVEVFDIRPISLQRIEYYIQDRLAQHEADPVPECTVDEKWEKPTRFAVMKTAASKRATKLHDHYGDARDHAAKIGGMVQTRKGVRTRCEAYCPVAKFCSQKAKEDA